MNQFQNEFQAEQPQTSAVSNLNLPETQISDSSLESVRAINPKVEAYLDQVCVPLSKTLSREALAEARAEIKLHLLQLIDANIELDSDENEATQFAI